MTYFDPNWYENYQKKQSERHENAVASVKELAARLKPFGVTKLVATYDGYGDSGDFEDVSLEPDTLNLEDVLGAANTSRQSVIDALWPLLPGGFEINEGSYGELVLDVETGKIHRTHNKRIETVETTEDEL